MPLEPGRSAEVDLVVTDADLATTFCSGDVDVLATPRIVALAEEASCAAVTGGLEPNETTVGMRVQLDHLAPTAVGRKVTAESTLEKVEGRRLTFTVSVSDPQGLVAAGKVTRVIVDREQFLKKAR